MQGVAVVYTYDIFIRLTAECHPPDSHIYDDDDSGRIYVSYIHMMSEAERMCTTFPAITDPCSCCIVYLRTCWFYQHHHLGPTCGLCMSSGFFSSVNPRLSDMRDHIGLHDWLVCPSTTVLLGYEYEYGTCATGFYCFFVRFRFTQCNKQYVPALQVPYLPYFYSFSTSTVPYEQGTVRRTALLIIRRLYI